MLKNENFKNYFNPVYVRIYHSHSKHCLLSFLFNLLVLWLTFHKTGMKYSLMSIRITLVSLSIWLETFVGWLPRSFCSRLTDCELMIFQTPVITIWNLSPLGVVLLQQNLMEVSMYIVQCAPKCPFDWIKFRVGGMAYCQLCTYFA